MGVAVFTLLPDGAALLHRKSCWGSGTEARRREMGVGVGPRKPFFRWSSTVQAWLASDARISLHPRGKPEQRCALSVPPARFVFPAVFLPVFSSIRVPARYAVWMQMLVGRATRPGAERRGAKGDLWSVVAMRAIVGSSIQDASKYGYSWFNGGEMMKQRVVLQAILNTVAMARGREICTMRLVYLSEPRDNDLILVDRRDPCFHPTTSQIPVDNFPMFLRHLLFADSNP